MVLTIAIPHSIVNSENTEALIGPQMSPQPHRPLVILDSSTKIFTHGSPHFPLQMPFSVPGMLPFPSILPVRLKTTICMSSSLKILSSTSLLCAFSILFFIC